MLDTTANTIVLLVFGLIIGASFALFSYLAGIYSSPSDLGFKFWTSEYRQKQKKITDQQWAAMMKAPRSAKLAAATALAFILVLTGVLFLSPVEMHWWVFLGALFGGLGSSEP